MGRKTAGSMQQGPPTTGQPDTNIFSSRETHPHPGSFDYKLQKWYALRRPTQPIRASQPGHKRNRRELHYGPVLGQRFLPDEPWCDARQDTQTPLITVGSNPRFPHVGHGTYAIPGRTATSVVNLENSEFRSTALACEMTYREAKNALDLQVDDTNSRKPNAQFIATCCRVLGELAPACGPFRHLLTELREDFALHLYADFDKPAPGRTKLCEQPFFNIVGNCKAQIEELLGERARLRKELASEVTRRRDTEVVLQRLSAQISERDRSLQEARETLARLVHSTESSRDNYNRMRQDHEEIAKELQVVVKAKEESEATAHHQLQIFQIRLSQVTADLNKALQELKHKNEEINHLKLQQRS